MPLTPSEIEEMRDKVRALASRYYAKAHPDHPLNQQELEELDLQITEIESQVASSWKDITIWKLPCI